MWLGCMRHASMGVRLVKPFVWGMDAAAGIFRGRGVRCIRPHEGAVRRLPHLFALCQAVEGVLHELGRDIVAGGGVADAV